MYNMESSTKAVLQTPAALCGGGNIGVKTDGSQAGILTRGEIKA